jgi:hypothetical protein
MFAMCREGIGKQVCIRECFVMLAFLPHVLLSRHFARLDACPVSVEATSREPEDSDLAFHVRRVSVFLGKQASVDFQRTARCYIQEDRNLHYHRCENLKSLYIADIH